MLTQIYSAFCVNNPIYIYILCDACYVIIVSPLHWFEINFGYQKGETVLSSQLMITNDSAGTVTDIASVRTKIKVSLTLCIMAVSRIKLL